MCASRGMAGTDRGRLHGSFYWTVATRDCFGGAFKCNEKRAFQFLEWVCAKLYGLRTAARMKGNSRMSVLAVGCREVGSGRSERNVNEQVCSAG